MARSSRTTRTHAEAVAAATPEPLRESVVGADLWGDLNGGGPFSQEDYGWRPLTAGKGNEGITTVTQRRALRIGRSLFRTNGMAKRSIRLFTDYCVAEGFEPTSSDESVQEILTRHWEDWDNDWTRRLTEYAEEILISGELCLRTHVNENNGHVTLELIPSERIKGVAVDNGIVRQVVLMGTVANPGETLNVIAPQSDPTADGEGRLMGDVFFFAINADRTGRGYSDLLPVADWLKGHDTFLWSRLERAQLLNMFLYIIKMEGASPAQIEEYAKKIAGDKPRPGSFRVVGDKETWETVEPKLGGADAMDESRLYKGQIVAGTGIAEHLYGWGESSNRATAATMNDSVYKTFSAFQRLMRGIVLRVLRYVTDQAVLAGRLDETVTPHQPAKSRVKAQPGQDDAPATARKRPAAPAAKPVDPFETVTLTVPEMIATDMAAAATTLQTATAGLATAHQAGMVDMETCHEAMAVLLQGLGLDIDADTIAGRVAEEEEERAANAPAMPSMAQILAGATGQQPPAPGQPAQPGQPIKPAMAATAPASPVRKVA